MIHLHRNGLVACVFSAILSAGGASAQTNTSAIAGIITDETGATVPSATVTVTETATGQVRTTSASGEYVVSQLPPGKYEVKVAAPGFQTALASNVTLDVAEVRREYPRLTGFNRWLEQTWNRPAVQQMSGR